MIVRRIVTRAGAEVLIRYRPMEFKGLDPGESDTYIVSSETGFSPLGSSERLLSQELGVPISEIRRLADWNRFENPRVTLVAISSRRPGGFLRGVLLAPSESSACYAQFATPRLGRPHRDFYYNVAYEAFAYAMRTWEARRIAISHLSACGTFHQDIATCIAEALAHSCEEVDSLESMIFLADTEVRIEHLAGISGLSAAEGAGAHRHITVGTEQLEGATLLHLDWSDRCRTKHT